MIEAIVHVEVPQDRWEDLFDVEELLRRRGVSFDSGMGIRQLDEPTVVRDWFVDGVGNQNIWCEDKSTIVLDCSFVQPVKRSESLLESCGVAIEASDRDGKRVWKPQRRMRIDRK